MKNLVAGCLVIFASGCSTLVPTPHSTTYSLDGAPAASAVIPAAARAVAPTLVVSPPYAAAGFDSPRMMYLREAHKLEYFAHNEWTDTPARMLAPLIVAAVEHSRAFGAVVLKPSTAAGDLLLDIEVRRLQHEFLANPSSVRFTLRATVLDVATRRVLGSRDFEAVAAAPAENPYGGVLAANLAVRTVLDELAAFCASAARGWRPGTGGEVANARRAQP